jgi:hypothetical protein
MNADLGLRKPATRSSNEVFPAPEGPKITVTRLRISTSTSSVKDASGTEMFLSNKVMSF